MAQSESGGMALSTARKATTLGVFPIIVWASLWGAFEATAGYLLHLLPVSVGWLVWYPNACFFMYNAYRKTGNPASIAVVGVLSASIKMLNLLMPGRIDRVVNPAVSIVLEALTMSAAAVVLKRRVPSGTPLRQAIAALSMNTGWRVLYMLYLMFLVPDWMRQISVISSAEQLFPFLVTQNLATSAVLYVGYLCRDIAFRPLEAAERRLAGALRIVPRRGARAIKFGAAGAIADLLAHHMLRVHEGDADGLPVHLEPHEELAPLQGKRRDKQRIQIYGSRPFRAEKLRLRPGQQQRQRGLAVDHGSSDVSAQGDLALGGVIRDAPAARREHALAERYIRELNIVTPSAEQETVYLSGGNQQKVVIGKWLNADSDVLIVDEPTRGIDVGAKKEIYGIMSNLAKQGKAILMISSEMPELLGMCDRIVVMHNGRITGEVLAAEATQDRLMELAIQ